MALPEKFTTQRYYIRFRVRVRVSGRVRVIS